MVYGKRQGNIRHSSLIPTPMLVGSGSAGKVSASSIIYLTDNPLAPRERNSS